ncbi:MAG: vWA domain-containing protein [Acidobacteriaceae bacterium]
MTEKNRQPWAASFALFAGTMIVGVLSCGTAFAQAPAQSASPSPVASQLVQQAQTIRVPINVFNQADISPLRDLKRTDLTLDVDSKPANFQLSRPWDKTINPKTGQAEDQPNMLIILPAGGPLDRNDIVNETIEALKTAPISGWNISILDDGGNQTQYTRQLPLVISELEKIGVKSPQSTTLADWRHTAATAIADMRDLPGRRVVLSLGDLFHEIVDQGYGQLYNAFEVIDVSTAARAAGVILYSAQSSREVDSLRRFPAPYSLIGTGPWMLLSDNNFLAGWICGPVADTLQQIQNDGMASYDLDLHLNLKQMDGLPHSVSVTANRKQTILNAPTFYMAPNLTQLQELSRVSAPLRQALKNPQVDPQSPLQLGTQMEYFPHPDGKTGTQVVSTGLLWAGATPPPSSMELAEQFQQPTTGFMLATTVNHMDWYAREPIWNTAIDVGPGDYRLTVAAADSTGKITAGHSRDFSVAPTDPNETVRISSLVIGRSCLFVPPPAQSEGQPAQPQRIDYLRAGNCSIHLEPSHSYSPQDVLWTLVRITPVGKLANRPAKDWKGDFILLDAKGSSLAKQPVHWLGAEDGSYVATTAFQLGDPKLKLEDGEYAVVLTLKGPGIEEDYSEDAPFLIFGAGGSADPASSRSQHRMQ